MGKINQGQRGKYFQNKLRPLYGCVSLKHMAFLDHPCFDDLALSEAISTQSQPDRSVTVYIQPTNIPSKFISTGKTFKAHGLPGSPMF